MRGSLKVIICFQTRIEKYIENNLPQKLSRYTRNRIPPKSRSTCHWVHHKIRLESEVCVIASWQDYQSHATKVNVADFKINFIFHSNQRMQYQTYHAHGTIKTHSGNWTSIVHAVQGKKCTHASTKTGKLEFVCLELASLQPMQNKMKNNVNPYRSLQVMHVRLRRFNSSLVK